MDPKELHGIEVDIRGSQHFSLDQNEEDTTTYALERMDVEGENYFQDQVIILNPQQGTSKQIPFRLICFLIKKKNVFLIFQGKKISGVYKVYKTFNLSKKISKNSIIKTVPVKFFLDFH